MAIFFIIAYETYIIDYLFAVYGPHAVGTNR